MVTLAGARTKVNHNNALRRGFRGAIMRPCCCRPRGGGFETLFFGLLVAGLFGEPSASLEFFGGDIVGLLQTPPCLGLVGRPPKRPRRVLGLAAPGYAIVPKVAKRGEIRSPG